MELFLLLLLALIALFFIMVAAIWATNRAADGIVGSKHRLLETIVDTGDVPPAWSKSYAGRIARLQQSPDHADRAQELQQRAQQAYLERLDQLIQYAQGTPLVADNETRALLLDRLTAVRADWAARTPSQF